MTPRVAATPVKFVIVGIANTFTGLAVIYLFKWLLGFGDVLANVCGYAIGLGMSFILNRGWTFGHTGSVAPAFMRFVTVFVLAYLLNLATVLVAIRSFGLNSYLAQAVGIAPYTVFFYLGSRYFAFRAVPARSDRLRRPS